MKSPLLETVALPLQETIRVDAMVNPHSHLREGAVVCPLIKLALDGGVDVLGPMPNTTAGLTTAQDVNKYINGVGYSARESGLGVRIIPIVMLTESTTREEIEKCVSHDILDAKVYPRGRTTKSEKGVLNYGSLLPIVDFCGKVGMRVHFHPEHPSPTFTNRDAESAFLPLLRMFVEETCATIISEHGTDGRCIPHWRELAESDRFFVTLTAHHLATTEDKTFGNVQATCKPSIKTESDREALVALIEEGHGWVMAGADDAPHDMGKKHVLGCCACGAYTAPFLLPLYAESLDNLLETRSGVRRFIAFTSGNARKLYGLPSASREIKLGRHAGTDIPERYEIGSWKVEPFWAGRKLNWGFV